MLYHNIFTRNWKHPVLGLMAMLLSLTVFSQGPERASEDQVVQFSETTAIRSADGGQTWDLAKGTLEDVPYWAQVWLNSDAVVEHAAWIPKSAALELEGGGILRRPAGDGEWSLESSRLDELPYWAQGWLKNAPIERPTDLGHAPVESMCRGENPVQRTQTVQVGTDLAIRSFDGGVTWAMAEGKREDLPTWAEVWLNQPIVEVLPAKELMFGDALIRSVDDGQTWTLVQGEMDDLPGWVQPWVGGNYPANTQAGAARAAEGAAPEGFALYPNPTSSGVTLRFELERTQEVRVLLYDLQGKLVREVQKGRLEAGVAELQFSVADLAVGPYFLQLIAEDRQERIRLIRSH